MKITEISDPILNALRKEKFVGNFEVTISHSYMPEGIKITGYKPNDASYPYDFSCKLQTRINEICFKIVCGLLTDGDFTFDIKGQIEYLYSPDGV